MFYQLKYDMDLVDKVIEKRNAIFMGMVIISMTSNMKIILKVDFIQ